MLVNFILYVSVVNYFLLNVQSLEFFTAAFFSVGILSALYGGRRYCDFMECCDKSWIKNDLNGLAIDMKGKLHGQHLASSLVLNAVKEHVNDDNPSRALVLAFHGRTGSGKNHLASLIVNRFFKSGFKSRAVNMWYSKLHFAHESKIERYKGDVQSTINKVLSFCERAVFIFDEADCIPDGVIDVINLYMDGPVQSSKFVDPRKATFIFLSNTGGNDIAKIAEAYFEQDKNREEITMADIQPFLKTEVFKEKGNVQKRLGIIVPFLPLEEKHVQQCIEDYLTLHRCTINEKFVRKVSDSLEYDSAHVFSLNGCKTVEAKISFFLEDECS